MNVVYQRLFKITAVVTALLAWPIGMLASLIRFDLPRGIQFLLSFIIAFALLKVAFDLIYSLIRMLAFKVPAIQRWILGKNDFAGTWVGAYYTYGKIRYTVDIYEQDFEKLSLAGNIYSTTEKENGDFDLNHISTWTSISAGLFDDAEQVVIPFEDRADAGNIMGYGRFMVTRNKNNIPSVQYGYIFEIRMFKEVYTIRYRMPDNIARLPHKQQLEYFFKNHKEEALKFLGDERNLVPRVTDLPGEKEEAPCRICLPD